MSSFCPSWNRNHPPYCLVLALSLLSMAASAQYGARGGDWKHYGGDRGSTKYSPLDQIDAENFEDLEVIWRWESPDKDVYPSKTQAQPYNFRGTPIVIDGVAYMSTGLSQIAAIDLGTGETLWVYDPESWAKGSMLMGLNMHRGMEYWTDGNEERLLIATGKGMLVSVDAATGRPDPGFADGLPVDTTKGLGREVSNRGFGHTSAVIVVKDTIIVGSTVNDFPLIKTNPPGHVRGYDVRSGALKWRFNTIPQEGEVGVETWKNDSWKYTGNTNVWAAMSVDEELGYIYLPVSTPSNDYYGGHRPGDNLFAESLVCVDASTGERVWHFQAVHHGLWDYDFPCAPNLIDITVNGKRIKAVAQVSKQGFVYVFDRITGEPVWPIEERPVPQSTVEGEESSPTQPFPTKPPPFERQGLLEDDLIDFTPELRAEALEIVSKYKTGPLFTPPVVGDDEIIGTINLPGTTGGANWPGASVDPETGFLYVPSISKPTTHRLMKPDPNRSDMDYILTGGLILRPGLGPQGLPIMKPPYRRITAYDLNKGEIAWQVPFGEGPTQHPAIKHLNLGPLGTQFPTRTMAEGGIVVTKTLLITHLANLADETGARTNVDGSFLQAYDKATGELVSSIKVDRWLHGAPMTCSYDGRQLILVTGGGRGEPSELLAFALPEG